MDKDLWLYGAHGGAGVSTLIRAGVPALDAGSSIGGCGRAVVVCRSHAYGLKLARDLAAAHARGIQGGGKIAGLIVVADAPKLSTWLRSERAITVSDYPRHWYVPWLEEWRHCADGELPVPPRVRDLITELREATAARTATEKETHRG